MSTKRILYVFLIAVVAGVSALSGAVAGGAAVFRAVQSRTSLPAPIRQILPASNTNPNQTFTLNTTDIQTTITQSVQKVGPAVVTVVGTIPGQTTFFGQAADQTVSGSGFFISDQGYIVTAIQLPPAATRERAKAVLESVEQFYMKQPQVDKVVGVLGFSFFGRGQNMALAFVRLKDWDDRPGKENSAQALIKRANMEFFRMKQAMLFAINPPPIPELASAGGFDFRLQDRTGQGRDKLLEARNMALGIASKSTVLAGVRPEGQEAGPQLFLDIDRDAALARVAGRNAHFFSANLVDSQFATLESPIGEAGVLRVDATAAPAQLQAEVSAWLHDSGAA